MIKKTFFAAMLAIAAVASLQAQTARQTVQMPLEQLEAIYPFNLLPDYEDEEGTLISKYAEQISANAIFDQEVGDQETSLWGSISFAAYQLCSGEFPIFDLWTEGGRSTIHRLARNKKFRAFIAEKACAFAREIFQLYPRVSQEFALATIDRANELIMEMSHHKYEIKSYTYEYGYSEEVIVKDGKYCLDMNDDYEMIHGLEGWLVRRMVYDQVPLVEMRNYLMSVRKSLAAAKTESDPEFETIYNINDHILICTLPNKVLCMFKGGAVMDDVRKIQCFNKPFGTYYKLCLSQEYEYEHKAWVALYGLYDSAGNLIMVEHEWSDDYSY